MDKWSAISLYKGFVRGNSPVLNVELVVLGSEGDISCCDLSLIPTDDEKSSAFACILRNKIYEHPVKPSQFREGIIGARVKCYYMGHDT